MDFFGISINFKQNIDNLKLKNDELEEYCKNLERENKDIRNENKTLYEEKTHYKKKYFDICNEISSIKEKYNNNNEIMKYINNSLIELLQNDNINSNEIQKIINESNKLQEENTKHRNFYYINEF